MNLCNTYLLKLQEANETDFVNYLIGQINMKINILTMNNKKFRNQYKHGNRIIQQSTEDKPTKKTASVTREATGHNR
ncbi:hypothetical protein NQ317_008086 [Molorchus minor]|uniref:Uncharacterized protein n=1 Tax=Molorchus minor TaxID=1323400 RepID=A0ABQ9IPS3_9CUCU|nr:hypothetical protein NQ317_008086 [Molorchus minor]